MPGSVSSILICFTEHAFSYIWLEVAKLDTVRSRFVRIDHVRVGDVAIDFIGVDLMAPNRYNY